ncbi:MAG: hypothetical protein E4H10_04675 [Bacteroidia bacterium]|nr:MAG: hypothetical protein E4H10_04675 [Bacteroidia bacterium]
MLKKYLLVTMVLLGTWQTSYSQEMGLTISREFNKLGAVVVQAEFSPFRSYFVYSLGNNTARIFDRNWEIVWEHQGNPESYGGAFAFSPDENYLALGKYRGANDIAIIRLKDMKVVQVLGNHQYWINDLEFSHDGRFLVSVAGDEKMNIWELSLETFQLAQNFEFENEMRETSFSFDDKYLVACDIYGNTSLFKAGESGFGPVQEARLTKGNVTDLAFHPTNYTLLMGTSGDLRRYNLRNDLLSFTDSIEVRSGTTGSVLFSPDGQYVSYCGPNRAVIARLDKGSIQPVDYVFRHTVRTSVYGASFSEDGEFLTSYGEDQQILIWEIENVSPSGKSSVAAWLNSELTLAQRRSLTPGAVKEIAGSVDKKLTLPRDEFESSREYNARVDKLADWTLMELQTEMEKLYGVHSNSGRVQIPLQGLVGYNADLEIYKIRFMETEAGVAMPISSAKKFKEQWGNAYIRAMKVRQGDRSSYLYGSFELSVPGDKMKYPVTPLENPFHPEEQEEAEAGRGGAMLPKDTVSMGEGGTTYALMFATNVYDYYSDLVNPVLDAQTIGAELSESYGVVSEVVINATLSEIAAKIREFATRPYQAKDNLMVFFAGHGVYDEVFKEGYVISRDSRMDDVGKTSYLSHSNLRTMVNNIGCPHIFLVMDVCFGGTFDPHLASLHRGASSAYADVSTEDFVERKMKYKTRLYLTSGGNEYVPDGRPGFHSPFARRFIESLRYYGGDDGVLTTAEILQFVEKVNPQPRFGEFGDNEPGSDFILIVK